MSAPTHDGLSLRLLVIVDKFTQDCLSIDAERSMSSDDVLDRLSRLMATIGVPEHVRSNNGSEFTSKHVREWLRRVGV